MARSQHVTNTNERIALSALSRLLLYRQASKEQKQQFLDLVIPFITKLTIAKPQTTKAAWDLLLPELDALLLYSKNIDQDAAYRFTYSVFNRLQKRFLDTETQQVSH